MSNSRGFFDSLSQEYGNECRLLVKEWATITKKLASLHNRKIFLLECKRNQVYPNHIINNVKCIWSLQCEFNPFVNDADRILYKFRRSILKLEIKITLWKINKMENQVKQIKAQLRNILQTSVFVRCSEINNSRYKHHFTKIKNVNIKKFRNLCRKNKEIITQGQQHTTLYNFTNVQLPEYCIRVLNLAPKVGVPLNRNEIPIPTLIKDVEYGISRINIDDPDPRVIENVRNNYRLKVINSMTNFYSRQDNLIDDRWQNLLNDFKKTRQFLKDNKDIIVMRADKGGSTVIMRKDEYVETMRLMLSDSTVYSRIDKDPTNKFQTLANNLVNNLEKDGAIDNITAKGLKTHNAVPPRIYGLRKIHKEGCKLRPVVSSIKGPSYKLGRYIHQLLSPLVCLNNINVKDSTEFVAFINRAQLPKNYILISLDVVSLFTNVPKMLVNKIIEEKWDSLSEIVKMKKDLFIRLMNSCFDLGYFSFEEKFYVQLDGTTMGGPASPTIANFVMQYILEKVSTLLPFEVKYMRLYVDDMFMAVPNGEVDNILNYFNGIDDKIQFTIEKEMNGCLPFLDVMVIRETDGTLKTNWYTKPTSSGRLLNFLSNHPMSQKKSVALGLLHRAINLSHESFHIENIERVKQLLKNNNYPPEFVNKCIERFKENQRKVRVSENKYFFKFPFIKSLSPHISRAFIGTDWKPASYNIKTIGNLYTKLKDKVDERVMSELIYAVPCECGKKYVGQTKQWLKSRTNQHRLDCRPVNIIKSEQTALARHHFNTGHNFDFSKISILDREDNYRKRCVSEMIHIYLNNTVNLKTDTNNLSCLYNGLLDSYKKCHKNRYA